MLKFGYTFYLYNTAEIVKKNTSADILGLLPIF